MIDGKMKLKSIFRFASLTRKHAGVIDEDVQPSFVCCTSTSFQPYTEPSHSNSQKTVLLNYTLTVNDIHINRLNGTF